jgi:hypothetical protein
MVVVSEWRGMTNGDYLNLSFHFERKPEVGQIGVGNPLLTAITSIEVHDCGMR